MNRWERGEAEPRMEYRSAIRRELNNNDDPDLFKNYPEGQYPHDDTEEAAVSSPDGPDNCQQVHTEQQLSPPCQEMTTQYRIDSSDAIDIQESEEEPLSMDKLRRELINLAAGASAALVTNTPIVIGPFVDGAEYIPQARIAIGKCWDDLYSGNHSAVIETLNAHVPSLTRFANSMGPFKRQAARLVVEAKILQIILAKHRLDYVACDAYCAELPEYAESTCNASVLAIALMWQGNTYDSFFHLPHKAISILNNALSHAEDNALLRSAIQIDLSIAYSQDKTQEGYEQKARNYSELAHVDFPVNAQKSPFYRCIGVGSSELYHFDGIMYLHLARNFSSKYAQIACDTFEKSLNEKVMSPQYSCSLLIRKADALLALGDRDECINCLTKGYTISIEVVSAQKLTQIRDVLHRIPSNWQQVTAVQELQKEVSHALIIARR